jgi:hypothetical protein
MLYVNLSHAPKKPPASAARIQSPQQNECVTTAKPYSHSLSRENNRGASPAGAILPAICPLPVRPRWQ